MPFSPPKTIQSPQRGPYQHWQRVVEKHIATHYRRPYREHNVAVFEQLKTLVERRKQSGLILDSCCGTGLSTQRLAQANPDSFVIGIDQSASRLDRESEEFTARDSNSVLFQANCEDIWRLCVNANIQFDQHYILYPNPYPKPEHFKRRWHGHPCFPYLAKLSKRLELRSNWSLYLDEFALAWKLLTDKGFERQALVVANPLTLFEKKYSESGQRVYGLTLHS